MTPGKSHVHVVRPIHFSFPIAPLDEIDRVIRDSSICRHHVTIFVVRCSSVRLTLYSPPAPIRGTRARNAAVLARKLCRVWNSDRAASGQSSAIGTYVYWISTFYYVWIGAGAIATGFRGYVACAICADQPQRMVPVGDGEARRSDGYWWPPEGCAAARTWSRVTSTNRITTAPGQQRLVACGQLAVAGSIRHDQHPQHCHSRGHELASSPDPPV